MTHFAPVQKKELFTMVKVNQNYLKLPGSYLFSEVARRIAAHSAAQPEAKIIKLSIGDVTRPLVPAVVEAMHKAVDEQGTYEGFHGYGPEQGYPFLREAIAQFDYQKRGWTSSPRRSSSPTAPRATAATSGTSSMWTTWWPCATPSILCM